MGCNHLTWIKGAIIGDINYDRASHQEIPIDYHNPFSWILTMRP